MWISRKRSLAWAGVARTSRLLPQSQVVGSHCLDQRICPLTAKTQESGGVWPAGKVMFRMSRLTVFQFWEAMSPASSLLAPRESSSIN